ncbi:unknown [Bacteroides sp. CAG:754]|jgi:hypothetical protein|nr:unknown [Bacteroides sp. CAG:754]
MCLSALLLWEKAYDKNLIPAIETEGNSTGLISNAISN